MMIRLFASAFVVCCLFFAVNCDTSGQLAAPSSSTSALNNTTTQAAAITHEPSKVSAGLVQPRSDAQTGSKVILPPGLTPSGAVLHRRRRALAKGRKILLAKAPKSTTTTTTTTTTTEPPPSEAPPAEAEGDEPQDEEEPEQEAPEGAGEPETPSSTKPPAVVTLKAKVVSGSAKQPSDKKGRKLEIPEAAKASARNSSSSSSSTEVEASAGAKNKKKPVLALPFIKPKNDSVCTPEAYLEFPHDLIGNKWRARGLVVIHVAVVCYMFYSLALVCERYFMPSLEEFSQRLQLSEDVAGATLMSAGSSAPELFTAILGVFIAKGDVGTGAIVGSAVFNILFVIGICAFVSTTTAQLNWWPVLRDSVFYTFTVLVLIVFIYDERVTALESFAMIALYGLYILIMVHNETIKAHVTRGLLSHPVTSKLISSAVSIDGPDDVFGSSSCSNQQKSAFIGLTGSKQQSVAGGAKTVEDDAMFLAAMLVIVQHKRLFSGHLRFQSAARYVIVKRQHRVQRQRQQQSTTVCSDEVNYFGPESEPLSGSLKGSGSQKQRIEAYASSATMSKNKFSIVSKDDYEFWNRPPEEGENYYIWLAKIPVNYVLHYTIPDCTLYPDKYLFTFLISITWTAIFSYIMVWMVTLIGYTFGIPDSVMGVTFLAAGTSIPDCYSSVHAARNGMADMAVSNSIGSNVFDILIGLSLPWFIQTAIYPGVVATINSRGVIYSVILLFLSLVVTIYLMNKYEWTLKPRLGLALLIAYGLFIVLTCMLEFNLFGHVNPPPCPVVG